MNKLTVSMMIIMLSLPSLSFAKVKKCSDFSTQAQAQAYHDKQKKADATGWKSLDRDGDGRACDCLPGGSGKNCPTKKK